ncbi:MAG: carbohydrate ABC transporter substrate-binding protein [Clostridia bacterium]|nr:carbohydrate ABC transporter substrate-binding protein [Clostridia bacterium]
MKRIMCIILAALLAVTAFVAVGCAEKPGANTAAQTTGDPSDSGDTTEPEVTEVPDDLPEMKFDKTFRVIIPNTGNMAKDIYTEDHETSDPLHDAVFRRNGLVEERFGVKFEISTDEYSVVNNTIRTAVKAGSDEYDLCFVHMVSGAALAQDNLVLPFEKLPYVDLSKPWWDQSIKNGFSIRNNLMMVNGDISPMSFSITSCMFFNKTMFDKNDLTYPYELVTSGKWTLDRLYELTKDMTKDEDGDGEVSPKSTADIFGLASWYLDVPYSFYYAAGGMLVSKDADDVPYYDPQLERDTLIYSKIYDVIIKNNAYYETNVSDFPNVAKTFADGRALFLDAKLATAEELREMDNEFGIIPVPKLKEEDDYKSFVNGATSMVCVPATVKPENREYVSIIIEGLASEAYRTITPVLYETYLKRKITRDADSSEMIDYIVRNRIFDMAYVNMHDGVGSYVRDLLQKGSTDISSTLKSYQKTAKKRIENIVKAFDKSLANS